MDPCHNSLLWLNWLSLVHVSVLVPGTQSERSPLHLHSAVASQWKPHHAISSPHRFLWLQSSNHSVTTPSLSLLNYLRPFPSRYNLILVLFLRFNCMWPPPPPPPWEWLSESHRALSWPQLQPPDRGRVWTQWMIYWTLLTARQFFFHRNVLFFCLACSHFKSCRPAAVGEFVCLLQYIGLIKLMVYLLGW